MDLRVSPVSFKKNPAIAVAKKVAKPVAEGTIEVVDAICPGKVGRNSWFARHARQARKEASQDVLHDRFDRGFDHPSVIPDVVINPDALDVSKL